MAKILLVEDNKAVSDAVTDALQLERHAVDAVFTAEGARAFIESITFDLIIFDWELPDGSGLELCRNYRASGGTAKVLILTGKDRVLDKTSGLDSGADDYLTKPFNADELAARIRALLRRTSSTASPTLKFGNIELDPEARTALIVGAELRVRPREFALLECFLMNPNKLITHSQLRNKVWWDEPEAQRNTVNAMVARLRTKLQDAGSNVSITSVPGEGFRMDVAVIDE